MVRVRLLWVTGDHTYLDLDLEPIARTIQYQGSDGVVLFCDTGETDAAGIDTYAERGCSWTRCHVNRTICSAIITEDGLFAAWAACDGQVRSAGNHHMLATAQAAADLKARCPHCRCARWICDQHRSVDDG
jgi:hypothetical protein